MIERGDIQAQIPLFDEIPEGLKKSEDEIRQIFDGTLGTSGITMTLNPITGEIIRARLFDLVSGRVMGYEPLARGKWVSPTHDIKEGSREFKKLERVYEDVKDKLMRWKIAHPRYGSIREWTTVKGKRFENSSDPKNISPDEWFEKASLNLVANADDAPEETMQRERPTHKRPTRQRTGPVTRSKIIHPDTISSKEPPKLADTRPTPASLRRKANKAREGVIRDSGTLGNRVRRAIR